MMSRPSLSLRRIFPIQSLVCFLSIMMHTLFDKTVVMSCLSSLEHESRLSWRLRRKYTVLNFTFITPVSTNTLPLYLDVTVLPSESSTSTSYTSIIVCNSPISEITCSDAPLSTITQPLSRLGVHLFC